MARIDVAYSNLRHALSEWKIDAYGRDCVLLFTESEEWLVGCPDIGGETGFVPTGEHWRDQPLLWNARSFVLSDKFIPYDEVKLGLVGSVGSQTVDRAGKRDERPVLIMQEWDALHEHHPAFRQSNIEEWFGVFVHEAFHAHQIYHPRVRPLLLKHAEAGRATAEELATFYEKNGAYREAVRKEYELLRAASDEVGLSASKARAALSSWLTLYEARQAEFEPALEQSLPGKEAWLMDGFETFLEGSARYVEARFLMAPTESSFAQLGDEPTFRHFAASKGKRPSELPGLGTLGPKYFYAIGMYLCFLLDVADPAWKSTLFSSDGLLITQVKKSVSPT